MSLKFVFVISWMFPLMMLAWIMYHEQTTPVQPVTETNARMRVRMCREHVDTAKADPNDHMARKAVIDCTEAGFLRPTSAETALD